MSTRFPQLGTPTLTWWVAHVNDSVYVPLPLSYNNIQDFYSENLDLGLGRLPLEGLSNSIYCINISNEPPTKCYYFCRADLLQKFL